MFTGRNRPLTYVRHGKRLFCTDRSCMRQALMTKVKAVHLPNIHIIPSNTLNGVRVLGGCKSRCRHLLQHSIVKRQFQPWLGVWWTMSKHLWWSSLCCSILALRRYGRVLITLWATVLSETHANPVPKAQHYITGRNCRCNMTCGILSNTVQNCNDWDPLQTDVIFNALLSNCWGQLH